MTAQIPPAFLAMFHMLEAAFPDWKPKVGSEGVPGTVDVYWQALSEFEIGDIASAVGHCVNYGGFAPRIAELREKAVEYRTEREKQEVERLTLEHRRVEDDRLARDYSDPTKVAIKERAISEIRAFLSGAAKS